MQWSTGFVLMFSFISKLSCILKQSMKNAGKLFKGNRSSLSWVFFCWIVISKKLLYNIIEITLRHGCHPANLLHIFRTPFFKNTSGGLRLKREHWHENINHCVLTNTAWRSTAVLREGLTPKDCWLHSGFVLWTFWVRMKRPF